jgi:hypothetical protein
MMQEFKKVQILATATSFQRASMSCSSNAASENAALESIHSHIIKKVCSQSIKFKTGIYCIILFKELIKK